MKNRQKKQSCPGMDESTRCTDGLMKLFSEWRKTIGYYSIFAAVPTLLTAGSHELRAQEITGNLKLMPRESDTFRKRRLKMNLPGIFGGGPNRRSFGNSLPSPMTPTNGSDDCPGTPIPAGSYTAASPYIDNGDTTGANDTVNRLRYFYYYHGYYYESHGPDRIYSFVVTSSGPNASISVTTNSPTYRPMIYVTGGDVTGGCPAGQGNTLLGSPVAIDDSRWGSGNSAVVQVQPSNLPVGRRYYLFIDSQVAGDAGPYTLTIKDMQISSVLPVRASGPDFDGDGRTDLSVYRPSDSTWYTNRSSQGFSATQFGLPTDEIVPGDYDGDGKSDMAIFRDGDWWILKSSDSTPEVIHLGQAGDIPVPADYTGDGRSEIAVFRSGQWWINDLGSGETTVAKFGLAGDKPVPADYTGDGRAEIAVFRNGQWWWHDLATGQDYLTYFGQPGDRPVPGNYFGNVDGYNKAVPAVYRNGTWMIYDSFSPDIQWGLPTDVPVPGDYNGDGMTDFAVYRDGVWWIRLRGSDQLSVRAFGQSNDTPVPAANLR